MENYPDWPTFPPPCPCGCHCLTDAVDAAASSADAIIAAISSTLPNLEVINSIVALFS